MITCPRCHKSFKSRQGLGNHLRFCQTVKEPVKKVNLPAPRSVTRPPDQSAPGKSFSNPEDRIRESLTWGIARRGRRYQAIPMLYTGMSYEEAEAAAERRNRIPFTPARRQVREEEDEEELVKVMLMLELMNR